VPDPSGASFALFSTCPIFSSLASIFPVQPGTETPPPATTRAASCAKTVNERQKTERVVIAAKPVTGRMKGLLTRAIAVRDRRRRLVGVADLKSYGPPEGGPTWGS